MTLADNLRLLLQGFGSLGHCYHDYPDFFRLLTFPKLLLRQWVQQSTGASRLSCQRVVVDWLLGMILQCSLNLYYYFFFFMHSLKGWELIHFCWRYPVWIVEGRPSFKDDMGTWESVNKIRPGSIHDLTYILVTFLLCLKAPHLGLTRHLPWWPYSWHVKLWSGSGTRVLRL